MIRLASDKNIDQVLLELKEYAQEVDVDFVRKVRTCVCTWRWCAEAGMDAMRMHRRLTSMSCARCVVCALKSSQQAERISSFAFFYTLQLALQA